LSRVLTRDIILSSNAPDVRKLQLTKNDKTCSSINTTHVHLIFGFQAWELMYISLRYLTILKYH